MDRALSLAQALLHRRGLDSPGLSAQLLLAHTLGLPRLEVLLQRGRMLTPTEWHAFWGFVARRALGEPVAQIVGRKEFYGRDFLVNRSVLVPRPETEHVVEAALERLPLYFSPETAPERPLRFADLGCGSGALAVTLALELGQRLGAKRVQGLALDLSPEALAVTRANAQRLGAAPQLLLVRGDFCALPLHPCSLDLLVSNPPYIGQEEYAGLSHEVRDFEPRQALVPLQDEGRTGLESIGAVLRSAAVALKPGGLLLMELGCTQGPAALHLAAAPCWQEPRILPDLAGLDRVLVAWRGNLPPAL